MKKILLLILTLSACSIFAGMKGPYKASGLAFFIVHDGGPLKIQAKLHPDGKESAAVVKILDAEEKEVFWKYTGISDDTTMEYDFGPSAPKGIYQIRTSGKDLTVDPVTIPEKKYGVMPSRCYIYFSPENQISDLYFLIPEGARRFSWDNSTMKMTITSQDGREFTRKKSIVDVSYRNGQIWKISMEHPNQGFRAGFDGMPMILCPDAATAKAINGSVEKAADGTVYPHKFQVRIHNWLKSLKKEDLKVDIVDLMTLEKEFRAEPKADGLLGPWGVFTYINHQLMRQNLDQRSPQFGEAPGGASGIAIANSLKAPFNPYAGKLEKRMLIAALPAFLKMKESETWEDSSSDYAGGSALGFVERSFPFYYGINSVTDPEMRMLWFDAEKRFCDRFSMFRVSCENQSSHFPFFYYVIGETMNMEGYKRMAADYIHGMDDPALNHHMKAGYQQEAYGPDVTYSGLGQSWQALYYKMSGNKEALEGCRKVHNFFSHACVREPDGKIVCASNFAHRTEGGWDCAQYGAGRELLKGEVEEAAVFFTPEKPVDFKKELSRKYNIYPSAIYYASCSFGPFLARYRFPSKAIENPRLPFEKKENFVTNFNDEFLAVRKPGYYLFSYLNGTAPDRIRNQNYKTATNPRYPTYRWSPVQGTSILWFKDYGAFIVGRNFNGNTHHMLRGDLNGGKIAYPDYWEQESTVSGDSIKSKGNLFQAESVTYTRTTQFLEKGIQVNLKVRFEDDITFRSLMEQIPFHERKKDFKIEYHVNGSWSDKPGMADAVRFCGKIVVRFDKAYFVSRGPSTQGFGSLRVELGKSFKGSSSVKMSYTILPE